MNRNRLTATKAKELIKRELGISSISLKKPKDMNFNPQNPYFQMSVGTRLISVFTTGLSDYVFGGKLVELKVHCVWSGIETKEFFYIDTLEIASEYTEMATRAYFCANCGLDYVDDNTYAKLKMEAQKACWEHFRQ